MLHARFTAQAVFKETNVISQVTEMLQVHADNRARSLSVEGSRRVGRLIACVKEVMEAPTVGQSRLDALAADFSRIRRRSCGSRITKRIASAIEFGLLCFTKMPVPSPSI